MTKLPIPQNAFAQHTIALGKTRAGKSSKLRLIVEYLLDHKSPVCVIDPKGDWWGLKSSADGKKAGYPVIIFGGEHADVPINEHSGSAVAELIATGNRPCIVDLGGWMVGQRTRFFIDFASTLFKLTKGARHLVIDECHNFAPQGRIMDPDSGKMLHWANRLASEGAGKGVTLISASQRPQKVHKDYVTSHETLIACRVIHPLDRSAIKEWIDGCADPSIGKEVMTGLAGLQRSQAYVWSPEIGFGPKLVEFPLFSTYDSFKPQDPHSQASFKGWASVDLEEVKVKLAKVVEEAKANDPKVLRTEIARLKAELARQPTEDRVVIQTNVDEVKRAHRAGFDVGYERGKADALQVATENTMKIARDITDVAAQLDRVLENKKHGSYPGYDHTPSGPAAASQQTAQMRANVPNAPRAPSSSASGGDDTFSKSENRILASLAFWNGRGDQRPLREKVAAAAGFAYGSGNFNNLLGTLKAKGAIDYPAPGLVELRTSYALCPSVDDVRRLIMSVPSSSSLRIVDGLISIGGRGSREDVARASNYQHGSGNFNNLLGSLRGIGLIDYPQKGEVELNQWALELLS